MDHMDWYLSTISNELVLPCDGEALVPSIDDRSPYDWFQLEVDAFNRRSSSAKFGLETLAQKGEGCGHYSQNEHVSVVDCTPRTSDSSTGYWFLGNQPDYPLENGTEQNDDIFMNSLLELDSPELKTPYELTNNSSDSAYRSISSKNLFEDMFGDSQNFKKGMTNMRSSKYCKSWDSPSADGAAVSGDKLEDSDSCLIANNSRSEGSPVAPMLNVVSSSKMNASDDGLVCRMQNHGATVLQDLEDIVTQLNQKTRICFRDALYRLAKRSKEQHAVNQNRRLNFVRLETSDGEVTGENLSHKQPSSEESKSNPVDRAAAYLMFDRLNCGPNDLPTAETDEDNEANTDQESYDHILEQSLVSSHSNGPTSLCDINNPYFDEEEGNSSQLPYELSNPEPAVPMEYIPRIMSH